MVRKITNWSLREKLDKAGYNKVWLYKDNGYFFIDDDEVDGICERLESKCIYICHFKQMTVCQWAETIIDMLGQVKDKEL